MKSCILSIDLIVKIKRTITSNILVCPSDQVLTSTFILKLKESSGKYFFLEDQWQYPRQDFKYCLQTNHFNFAIQAKLYGDYALLMRCK